jgi:hypothetical protein
MAMKICPLALLVAALAASSQAVAADGRPSNATLAAMGLENLHVMSDSEGLAVRGLGFSGAKAYGQSFAVVMTPYGSSGSTNGYNAIGKNKASGENFSFAGVEIKQYGGHDNGGGYGGGNDYGSRGSSCNSCGGGKPQSVSISAFAGGSSTGYRH